MSNQFNPLNFAPNLFFVILAATVFGLTAFLGIGHSFLTDDFVSFEKTYSPWRYVPLELWTMIAAFVSILLPVALLVWRYRNGDVKRIFLPYVLVLILQIFIEIAFRKMGFPGMSVFIGLIFTAYRVIQLVAAWRFFGASVEIVGAARVLIGTALILGLIFWTLNSIFLVLTLIKRETI